MKTNMAAASYQPFLNIGRRITWNSGLPFVVRWLDLDLKVSNSKLMRPAVCSEEERGLISPTAAGNRAYRWPWVPWDNFSPYKWGFLDDIVIYDVHFLATKLKGNFCWACLEWRVQKYCRPFSSKTDVTKSPCLVSSIDLVRQRSSFFPQSQAWGA